MVQIHKLGLPWLAEVEKRRLISISPLTDKKTGGAGRKQRVECLGRRKPR